MEVDPLFGKKMKIITIFIVLDLKNYPKTHETLSGN